MAVYGTPPQQPPYYTPQPRISFDVLGEAWQYFTAQMGTWLVATLIAGLIMGAVTGSVFVAVIVPALASHSPGGAFGGSGPLSAPIQLVGQVIIYIVQYFLLGGLYRMAIKQMRGESISVGDLFTVTDVVGPLILTSILVSFVAVIGTALCVLPGFVVQGLAMFAIPLVVDQRMGPGQAFSTSWNTLKGQWLMATLFYFVMVLIGGVGLAACGVGILFTYPVFVLGVAITYRNFLLGGGPPVYGAYPGGYPPAGYIPRPPGGYPGPVPGGYDPPAPGYPQYPAPGYAPQSETPQPTQPSAPPDANDAPTLPAVPPRENPQT